MHHSDLLSPAAVIDALVLLDEPRNAIERSVRRRVDGLRPLTTDARAHEIHADAIAPTRVDEFVALSRDERLALLVARAEERIRASRRGRTTRRNAASLDAQREHETAKTIDDFLRPSRGRSGGATPVCEPLRRVNTVAEWRFVVPCACSCGAMLAAPGPRPVVRYLDPSHRPQRRARRRTAAA